MKRHLLFLTAYCLIICFITGCAIVVAPTGGEKDITPPKVTSTKPAEGSVNFSSKEIHVTFNEFVQLKDINKFFLASPPFEKQPDIEIKKKSVVVYFNEPLKPATTYQLFFGNAIQDITENNPYGNYTYTFSTGDFLDSLRLKGTVINAFTSKPEKDILVVLYKNTEDSVPFKEKPFYLSRTDENGNFMLEHLAPGKHRLFAINDANANFLTDGIGESIAFADSLLTLVPIEKPADTAAADTIKKSLSATDAGNLYLFPQTDSSQRLVKAYLAKQGLLCMIFKNPVKKLEIKPLSSDSSFFKIFQETNATKDTVNFWLPGIVNDSAKIMVVENGKILDTTKVSLKIQVRTRKGKSEATDKPEKLTIESSLSSGGVYEIRNPLQLKFSQPLTRFNRKRWYMIEDKDTLHPQIVFSDSLYRKTVINHKWKENTIYKIFIPSETAENIFGQKNDTVVFQFKTRRLSEYGNIAMQLQPQETDKHYLLQLLNEKDAVLDQKAINGTAIVKFENLLPAKYQLKIIRDANNNGKWDTGDYFKKIQPEKVLLYSKMIEVRANWDIEEEWKF